MNSLHHRELLIKTNYMQFLDSVQDIIIRFFKAGFVLLLCHYYCVGLFWCLNQMNGYMIV